MDLLTCNSNLTWYYKLHVSFIINNLTFLKSHRFEIVKMLLDDGHKVSVCTSYPRTRSDSEAKACFEALGVTLRYSSFQGQSLSHIMEILTLFQLALQIFLLKPSIIHGVSPKGVMYAGLIGLFFRKPKVVLSFSGLGSLYTRNGFIFRYARMIYEKIISASLRRKNLITIVQNLDDKDYIINKLSGDEKKVILIKGSGVNFDNVIPHQFHHKENVILFPARVILEKGILHFLEAAQSLSSKYPCWTFKVAGYYEQKHLDQVLLSAGQNLLHNSNVEFLGHVENIYAYFRSSKIVCLPSYYREGLPLSLAEAAAHGCVIVTTNSVGCRDTVINGQTGLLVKPKSTEALIEALDEIISNEPKMEPMSKQAICFARANFDLGNVLHTHMTIYNSFFI